MLKEGDPYVELEAMAGGPVYHPQLGFPVLSTMEQQSW